MSTANGLQANVRTEVVGQRVRHFLEPLLADRSGLVVEVEGRAPASLAVFDATNLQERFVTADGLLRMDELWNTLVNGFPASCARELDAGSLSSTTNGKSVATHDFAVTSATGGIVIKARLGLTLKSASDEKLADATAAVLSLEGRYWWRRASDDRWRTISSATVVDPRTGTTGDDSAGLCSRRLAALVRK